MAAKTAVEVAEMESELYLLRQEKQRAETQIALLSQERDACKVELAIASARAREEMMKSTQLESIISQTSMGLVAALRSYHSQRLAERQTRLAAQERELGVGGEDAPTFLDRRQAEREAADDALSRIAQANQAPIREERQIDPGQGGRAMADHTQRLEQEPMPPRRSSSYGAPPPEERQRAVARTHHEMRQAADQIGRPVSMQDDHPLLPPLGDYEPVRPRPAGDLASMVRRTQEQR